MIEDTDPLEIANGELRLLPSADVVEAEDQFPGGASLIIEQNFSGDGTAQGAALQENATWSAELSTEYPKPDGQYSIAFRYHYESDHPAFDISLDGNHIQGFSENSLYQDYAWYSLNANAFSSVGELAAGTHDLEFQTGSGSGALKLDVIALRDERYLHPLEPSLDSDGWLDSPQLYPDVETVEFATATPPQPVTAATVVLSIDDTSGGQFIEISGDGGNTWHRTDNSATATAEFAEATTSIDVRVGLSRYGTRSTATPTEGYLGQAIDSYELLVDRDAVRPEATNAATVRTRVEENTIDGETLREAAQLSADGDALTRSTFAELDVIQDMVVIANETVSWENA